MSITNIAKDEFSLPYSPAQASSPRINDGRTICEVYAHHHILCMAELEKLGPRYRIALRIARDERLERLACDHRGNYADDCIIDRVKKHKIYVVATNDRELKRRSKQSLLSPNVLGRMILILRSKEGSRSPNSECGEGEICYWEVTQCTWVRALRTCNLLQRLWPCSVVD